MPVSYRGNFSAGVMTAVLIGLVWTAKAQAGDVEADDPGECATFAAAIGYGAQQRSEAVSLEKLTAKWSKAIEDSRLDPTTHEEIVRVFNAIITGWNAHKDVPEMTWREMRDAALEACIAKTEEKES